MSEIIHVHMNQLQDSKFTSLQEFCMACPKGAYTTAHVNEDFILMEWELHIERLIKSIAACHATLNACFANYYAALENLDAPGVSESSTIQSAVLPSLVLALTTAATRPHLPQTARRIATIVLSPGKDISAPLDINVAVVHEQQLPSLMSTSTEKTFATVLGPPRQVPVGKDSGWVAQRQPLEALRPRGAAEILLCTQQGFILEGLITNFYVICSTSSTESEQEEEEREEEEVVLYTAGMEDGVVWGTMRQRVLQVCHHLRLKVVEEAPDAAHRHCWREAFLTNALRRVQPLHRVECGHGNVWELAPWEVEFSSVPGSWTSKIQAHVENSLSGTDVRLLASMFEEVVVVDTV